MKLVPRSVAATEVSGQEEEIAAKKVVHRRIEVTVERETVSVLMRGRSADCADGTSWREPGAETPEAKLPPPAAQSPVAQAEVSTPEDLGVQTIRKPAR
jgi:hypothetical protein